MQGLHRRLGMAVLAAGLGVALQAAAWAGPPPVEPAALDSLVRDALQAFKVPGASVAVVRDDQVLYLKGFGVKKAGTTEAVTPDTRFAIGSTTKAFTTTAMGMLVDEGKLAWDDPVRKHVPFFRLSDPLADQNVTLRDLVSHRTGLSRHDLLWFGSPWSREEIIRRIGLVKLNRPFRSAFQYQNIAYLTAGYAAGTAAGGSWEACIRKRILEPLGMTNTDLSVTDTEKSPDRATPHLKEEDGSLRAITWRNLDNCAPAGSLNSSARDLARWVRFQLGDGTWQGKRLVSAATLEETKTPQMVVRMEGTSKQIAAETGATQRSYGLGWFIEDYRGQPLVSHEGNIDGFTARVALLPRAKLGIVVLANLNRTYLNVAVSHALTDTLLGLPRKDWNAFYGGIAQRGEAAAAAARKETEGRRQPDTKPSRALAQYAGSYEEPAYGTATVTLEEGALAVRWSSFKSPLEHWHYDTFRLRGDTPLESQRISFSLDADGEVSGLTLLGMDFKRAKREAAKPANRTPVRAPRSVRKRPPGVRRPT